MFNLCKGVIINISIIIPVYNENKINEILNTIKDERLVYEIIVVDANNNTTNDLIQDSNIIKISSRKGRSFQMNEGYKNSSGDILLFLHADTLLPKNALQNILQTLENKDISAGAFDLSFNTHNIFLKLIARISSIRSRITRLPYGDQAIFIKRDIFERVGCYKEIRLMEDVNLMQKLKKENYKIKILNTKIITSARKWEEKGIIYTTLRNWLLICLYFIGINPDKLSNFYK